jgi:hypothetical protein
MSRVNRRQVSWRATLLLYLTLPGLVFGSKPAIADRVSTTQTVFTLQRGTPAAIPNFLEPLAGCNWLGIGGQVFDQAGSPMHGLLIKVSGTLEGRQILQYVYTSTAQQFGPGGFALKLTDHLVSSRSLKLQILDAAGNTLSLPFSFPTYATCRQNLLVINLAATPFEKSIYLPKISR